ncbi:U3 small nucleolar RNA-associated protein 13 [Coniochaeta pulveracea]|uniref:U3 small nucleolar RNA-associated protein 13 n=1 Tax=Coniochaeta pulveracea TaxID=177199 RepID=A0A420YDQ3_9PEZI|nr:U3 small nucleolar RNA-associated protein 13 [Coniochaeta pulveracea]
MATKFSLKTTFEAEKEIQPVFTGGSVGIDSSSRILATTLGEDAVLTDLTTGSRLAFVEGDGEIISSLTLTPSASHLIVCSRSLSMRIYSLKVAEDYESVDATLTRTVKPHGTPVVALAVDKTSTLVATGAADGAIKVWDIQGGYVTHTFRGASGLVSSLRFFEVPASEDSLVRRKSKKGKKNESTEEDDHPAGVNFRLASGSQDGKVRVWDLKKRAVVANLESHVSDVRGIDYAAKYHSLVTASRDKTIIWWNTRTWEARKVTPCFELVEAVGFIGNGEITYSAGSNGTIRLWETETGREVTKEQGARAEGEGIVSALYVAESNLLVAVQVDHTLALYRLSLPEEPIAATRLAPLQPFRRISGTHDEIVDLAFVLPDQSLLALATNSEDVRLVSVGDSGAGDDHRYFGQDIALLKGHEEIVLTIDVDWSGHWVATGSKDNTARLWRIDGAQDTYSCYAVFTGHAESLGAVALPKIVPQEGSEAYKDPLNHPPKYLITGSQDQTIKKWEIPRQAQKGGKGSRAIYTRKAHDKDINALDINSAGQLFASASQDKTIKIWDVEAGEVQGILKGHRRGVWSVQFAPPTTPVIQGEQGTVSGKGVVLTGSVDKTIKLWSLADYTCIRTFEGHSNSVLKVVWLNMAGDEESASKRRVQFASAGGDGLVKVWDANLGETECTLDNHEDRVWALAVHPKTNALVSGSGDSTVTFWKDTTEETQAASAEAATKLIEQEQQLENYIHAGSYRDAIVLALQLNHPGRLLNLFRNVVTTENPEKGSLTGIKAVDHVLANLSDDQIFMLLLRLRDWNTNARTAPISQRILSALVRSYPANKFSNLSVKGARGQKSLQEVLNALKVYTERHYKRLEELVDESYLVEYTLREMDSLAPPTVGSADQLMIDV